MAEATARFQAALALWHEMGEQRGIAEGLEDLAGVAVRQGRPAAAVRWLAAAAAVRETIGAPLPPVERPGHAAALAAARAALGEAAFAAAWQDGQTWALAEIVAEALGTAGPTVVAE
jgi:hypothetical protein